MATQATHKMWLKVSAVLIAGFGPLLTLATMPALNEPARWTLDLLTWPLDGFPSYAAPEIWFLSALTGGFLVGWGVMVWCLSIWVHDHAPEQVRKALVVSALCWFVLDSFGSITSGNWPNAVCNIVVLLLVIGPMWWPTDPETLAQGDA
ncbi:hypothetical protein [uncultured Tateyamaria sp.]|uniref:hypothetical protein n=1 Tax=uncultured Tateyamaria sp. TaxID=455651 RepID=UPI002626E77E|nr:hypothetical protein [uncultured Tateyamaria sp.]